MNSTTQPHSNTAYIGLGSNLNDREALLREAVKRIAELSDTTLTRCSSMYETEPIGMVDQPAFLNMAVSVQTNLAADTLLSELLRIELEMGRVRTIKWGPRTMDLDVLFYNGFTPYHSEQLELPHPRVQERAFVIVPMLELLSGETHDEPLREWLTNALETLGGKEGISVWKPIN